MRNILWAEDSDGDRGLIQATLLGLKSKSNVTFTRDGIEFLAELERQIPDLAVLDVNMPVMSGLEALARLRRHPLAAGTPVVVFTASTRKADLEECARLGILRLVGKPMEFAAFQQAVSDIVAAQPVRKRGARLQVVH